MKHDKLRELTLDYGPDPCCWPADDRREAVIELFEADEQGDADWIGDCLSEWIAGRPSPRRARPRERAEQRRWSVSAMTALAERHLEAIP